MLCTRSLPLARGRRPAAALPLRTLATTSRLLVAVQKDAQSALPPTRSFKPHFAGREPALPSNVPAPSDNAPEDRKPSRPHEQWLISHPVYSPSDLEATTVVHLEPKTFGDKVARFLVWFARKGFDFVTGYKHATPELAHEEMVKAGKTEMSLEEKRKHGYLMTVEQWMARILFLESIAGVPGFTAAILRHLRSLRLMKRDGGWINSLLAEAENERMHLLTFMQIREPSMFFRFLVLGAQGVFFNAFFLSYLLSPRAAHRFVGYLEEEAIVTYTQIVESMRRGEIPEWDAGKKQVPQFAKDYWRLSDDATMLDLILAVRADEAGHRFTNHTLANLSKDDFNPVALKHAPPKIEGTKLGFTREESFEWARKVQEELTGRPAVSKGAGEGAGEGRKE